MASFFTDSEKTELENVLNDIHETFARPLTMFKKAQEVVINNNPTHSFIFESAPTNTDPVEVIVSGVFNGRILYEKDQKLSLFGSPNEKGIGQSQTNITLEQGRVRIKLDPTGAAFMQDAERVRLDGDMFIVDTQKRPHGLFDPKWTTFYLKRIN